MTTAVCTIITRNRLHLARVLMQSVAAAYPEAKRHVLVIDEPKPWFDPATEAFTTTVAGPDVLPRFHDYAFVNDVLGLACMLKPAFARYLLQRKEADQVVYLDSDMRVYASLAPVLEALQQAPVLLTPHALTPPAEGAYRSDADFVRAGTFNAGFFAVTTSTDGVGFLNWWLGAMMRERSLNDFWCRDQLWLNLAPVYFPRFAVFRHPGMNVAYWNLSERHLARTDDGTYLAKGERLLAVHYSLFDTARPGYLAHRQNVVIPAADPFLRTLVSDYGRELTAAGETTCTPWPYAYDTFTDGTAITAAQRRYFLDHAWSATDRVGSPFDPAFEAGICRGSKSVYGYHDMLPRAERRVRRTLRERLGIGRDR